MRVILICLVPLLCGSSPWQEPPPTTDIKIDQVGYPPAAPKHAMVVSTAAGDGFIVRSIGDGEVVFRGTLAPPALDEHSGDAVRAADFTALRTIGRFQLEVPGVGVSWPFSIAPDVYSRAFSLAMRSFYGQRCGTAVNLGPEFPGYAHEACHGDNAYHATSGKRGAKASGNKGWHDAGDYGRYVVNSGLSTGTLLWTYEMFGDRVGTARLDLPESGNGRPDILNEIRWNLDWMLSMQDADGGVFHKQTSEQFCPFVMPEKDTLPSLVIGTGVEPFKSSCATADLAAVMAIAARVYQPFDAPFARGALDSARRAFAWVEKNPAILYSNPKGIGTGAYGDRDCSDEILWAAAELWRTTRAEAYRRYFGDHSLAHLPGIRASGPPSWASVGAVALWTYVLGGGTGEAAERIREASIAAADGIVARAAADGYRTSLDGNDFVWGSNGVAANYGLQLVVADALKPDERYRAAAADNLHYLLGRNTFSLSFVTRVGANPYRHPHHRPSGADQNEEPWPGLLSGGPNANRQDPAMQALPDLPPAKMFLDDQESYASNEVAINWNAPLVFLLAAHLPRAVPAATNPGVAAAQAERLAASFVLALGRLPTALETQRWATPEPPSLPDLLARHRAQLRREPSIQRAVVVKAREDALGVAPGEGIDSEEGGQIYAELVQRHVARLAGHPAEYEEVVHRAYRLLLQRDAYTVEIDYWKRQPALSFALLVACIDDWALRNQPGLMATTGVASASVNSAYLATVRLSPAVAAEARLAFGFGSTGEEAVARAAGRNVVAPGGAHVASVGAIHFAAAGRSAR